MVYSTYFKDSETLVIKGVMESCLSFDGVYVAYTKNAFRDIYLARKVAQNHFRATLFGAIMANQGITRNKNAKINPVS